MKDYAKEVADRINNEVLNWRLEQLKADQIENDECEFFLGTATADFQIEFHKSSREIVIVIAPVAKVGPMSGQKYKIL